MPGSQLTAIANGHGGQRAGRPHPAETYRHILFPCFFLFVRLNFLLYIPREIRYNISTYFIE